MGCLSGNCAWHKVDLLLLVWPLECGASTPLWIVFPAQSKAVSSHRTPRSAAARQNISTELRRKRTPLFFLRPLPACLNGTNRDPVRKGRTAAWPARTGRGEKVGEELLILLADVIVNTG